MNHFECKADFFVPIIFRVEMLYITRNARCITLWISCPKRLLCNFSLRELFLSYTSCHSRSLVSLLKLKQKEQGRSSPTHQQDHISASIAAAVCVAVPWSCSSPSVPWR